MNIIFAFTVFHFSSVLSSKSELSEKIQLNGQNLIVVVNTFIIVPKMNHISLHSVGTNHKRFGWKRKKMKIYFVECPCKAYRVSPGQTLVKVPSFPSVNVWRSIKITVVSYKRLLTVICRASSFAKCLALDKAVFTECLTVSRVLLSIKKRSLTRVGLNECSVKTYLPNV
jgi:hypothetical protein